MQTYKPWKQKSEIIMTQKSVDNIRTSEQNEKSDLITAVHSTKYLKKIKCLIKNQKRKKKKNTQLQQKMQIYMCVYI